MIAQINGVDLSHEQAYFEHYTTGVYRHDGYIFNFYGFIKERCNEIIADEWVKYGVCDNYEQILDKYKDMLFNPNKHYVIGLCTVDRSRQPQKVVGDGVNGVNISAHRIQNTIIYMMTRILIEYTVFIFMN